MQCSILTIAEIQCVESFNILGIKIDQNLTWTEHFNYSCNKISRTIGVMNKLKSIIPGNILLLLYNYLILSHVNYGTLASGYNSKRIYKLKKKSFG